MFFSIYVDVVPFWLWFFSFFEQKEAAVTRQKVNSPLGLIKFFEFGIIVSVLHICVRSISTELTWLCVCQKQQQ